MARGDFFFETANSRHRNQMSNPQFFHGPNVSAKGNFARQKPVPTSMAWQKHNFLARHLARNQLVRRLAKGGVHLQLLDLFEAFHRIKATASDHTKFHARSCFITKNWIRPYLNPPPKLSPLGFSGKRFYG